MLFVKVCKFYTGAEFGLDFFNDWMTLAGACVGFDYRLPVGVPDLELVFAVAD